VQRQQAPQQQPTPPLHNISRRVHSVIGSYTEHRMFGEPTKGLMDKATPNQNKLTASNPMKLSPLLYTRIRNTRTSATALQDSMLVIVGPNIQFAARNYQFKYIAVLTDVCVLLKHATRVRKKRTTTLARHFETHSLPKPPPSPQNTITRHRHHPTQHNRKYT
jgi:hypothetical protein